MNTSLSILLIFICAFGCTTNRYTESCAEIEAFKKLNDAFVSGNMDAYGALYADSAKIYYNNRSPLTWQQAWYGMTESLAEFSTYKYGDNQDFEFVTTDNGEQWLSWWAVFEGTLMDTEHTIFVPVHITARFVEGKIVEESGYWDNQIITDALSKKENPSQ